MSTKIILSLLTLIVIALMVIGGYQIYKGQQNADSLPKPINGTLPAQTSPASTASPLSQSTTTPLAISSPSLTENAIKTNVNASNFPGLTPYMTGSVLVTLEATECCGPQTPKEAVDHMSYIKEGIPLNFDQEQEVVKKLKETVPDMTNTYIGISPTNENVAFFTIDNNNQISAILMAVTWKLYGIN